MKYVYLILNWIFGLLFLLMGLVYLIQSFLGGLCMIAIAALLLPPVKSFVYSKTNKELSLKTRAILIFALFIASSVFTEQSQYKKAQELAAEQAQKQAEKIAQIRQENINYFNANREQIISSVKTAFSTKEYQSVISQSSKYLSSGDKELEQFNSRAKVELAEIQKAEKAAKEKIENEAKTKDILVKLKDISSSQYELNEHFYQQLVNYNPENKAYKEKLNYYSNKIKEQQEKERIAQEKIKKESEMRIVKFGEPPIQSSWDGSYATVERYLEKVANDPESIKIDSCTKVFHTERGWLVGCDYRGRNGFGGMIRQSNWFTIVHDTVIQMHDASAYKP